MLYFSKLKLVIIYFIIFFLSLVSLSNFFEVEDNILLTKKVNLGLDLQGGSYLLLEVDSEPAFKQKLQDSETILLVVESVSGPVGQVRFEGPEGRKEISYSIGRQYRGYSLGKKLNITGPLGI